MCKKRVTEKKEEKGFVQNSKKKIEIYGSQDLKIYIGKRRFREFFYECARSVVSNRLTSTEHPLEPRGVNALCSVPLRQSVCLEKERKESHEYIHQKDYHRHVQEMNN